MWVVVVSWQLPIQLELTSLLVNYDHHPRDVKLNELEKVINQYQEKLNDVTQSYQQKIGILENKIIDKELETGYSVYVVSLSLIFPFSTHNFHSF